MLENAKESELKNLLKQWQSICASGGDEGIVFANDLEDKIDGLIKDIKKPDFFAYILKDEDQAIALLDIIHALPKSEVSWLKVFDMTITPKCTLGGGKEAEIIDTLTKVFMESLYLLLEEKNEEIKEIKIYARNSIASKLFKSIADHPILTKDLGGLGVRIFFFGKWLVLRKK